ncbi:MAG: phosphoenolpyruvate carboxykinase (GTP), partial [Micromonosporaceae bacterium]|nr:phosphoenolpyruvate carboxykinase (GTP) [Micromonosporaceae bacterium]
APEYDNPDGVPISAILFGGRRRSTIPLVTEARDWNHGVFLGSTTSSETTAAAAGKVGVVRRDPMAMLPFIGYNAGDYFQHWIDMAKGPRDGSVAANLPRVFYVNWFRKDAEGRFIWPGYGDNSRVLKWIIDRVEGTADAIDTPIGRVPTIDSLDTTGLDITKQDLVEALNVDAAEWAAEIPQIVEWFAKFGDRLPAQLGAELETLKTRLGLA